MIATKRRREDSITSTSTASQLPGSHTPSLPPSTPVPLSRNARYPEQRPKNRASLHRLGNRQQSSTPSTQFSAHRGQIARRTTAPSIPKNQTAREGNTGSSEENDSLDEIIMAVDLKGRGSVGCCYYVAREEKLYAIEDVRYGGLEVISTLKVHVQPTVVLLSMRVDETVADYFDPHGSTQVQATGDEDRFALPYVLEFRPSPEFRYDAGKNKLINLGLFAASGSDASFVVPGSNDSYDVYSDSNDIGYTDRVGKLLRLSTWIDMDSCITVGCAGALLTYIRRRKAVEQFPGDEDVSTCFRISAIEMFSLRDTMFVNADTLSSLQILQAESSPNTHSQGPTQASSGSKEGLSVYGLFHHLARTPQGKCLLRQYFIRPSMDLDTINERLDTASVFLRPENDGAMNNIVKNLAQIKNMRTVIMHLRKGVTNGLSKGGGIKSGIWSSLRSFAFHTLQIRDALKEIAGVERLKIATRVLETFDAHGIASVGTIISEIVDFAASVAKHRTVVNTGVSAELDDIKRTYDGVEDLLNHTSRTIDATIPAIYNLKLSVIFFPQIGFLICIPLNPKLGRGDYEGGEGEDRWERIFSTDSNVYYKDPRMREMDEELGDIYAVICDKEIEIIHNLGKRVLMHENMLTLASDICGELDRHPLQELTVPSYVANDTFLVGGPGPNTGSQDVYRKEANSEAATQHSNKIDSGAEVLEGASMLMMTGPNYSGKSVYLKQIALIVYMAHVGCFVPADYAIIGLTDKILTRIATRETVSKFQSAFMIDLQQIALAMSLATHRSLVIIDEFGKGTDSSDGAGLACGVFEYLLGLGENRPKALGATHFHEIFENGFLKPRPFLEFCSMEVRIDPKAKELEDQIVYLYNCAALNGVDGAIVARADELVEKSARGEDLVAACATMSNAEQEDLRDAEETAREFLSLDFRDLIAQDSDFPANREARYLLEEVLDPNQADP